MADENNNNEPRRTYNFFFEMYCMKYIGVTFADECANGIPPGQLVNLHV